MIWHRGRDLQMNKWKILSEWKWKPRALTCQFQKYTTFCHSPQSKISYQAGNTWHVCYKARNGTRRVFGRTRKCHLDLSRTLAISTRKQVAKALRGGPPKTSHKQRERWRQRTQSDSGALVEKLKGTHWKESEWPASLGWPLACRQGRRGWRMAALSDALFYIHVWRHSCLLVWEGGCVDI